jgi:hypothetical protein
MSKDLWRGRRIGSAALKTIVLTAMVFLSPQARAAEPINIEKLATAIFYAEGGSKTSHPYGILAKYQHTSPRQACINTIKHALRDWNGQGDFIAFLGSRYCPIGAENDPTGLNKNWVKNVRRLYEMR